jgi:hypothetical protein
VVVGTGVKVQAGVGGFPENRTTDIHQPSLSVSIANWMNHIQRRNIGFSDFVHRPDFSKYQ